MGTLGPAPPESRHPGSPVNRESAHRPSRWLAGAASEPPTPGKWDSERQEVLLKVTEGQR